MKIILIVPACSLVLSACSWSISACISATVVRSKACPDVTCSNGLVSQAKSMSSLFTLDKESVSYRAKGASEAGGGATEDARGGVGRPRWGGVQEVGSACESGEESARGTCH